MVVGSGVLFLSARCQGQEYWMWVAGSGILVLDARVRGTGFG